MRGARRNRRRPRAKDESQRLVQPPDLVHQPLGRRARVLRRFDRLAVCDAQLREPREPVRSLDRRRDERRAGLPGNARSACVRPGLVLLGQPLLLTRPLGKHDDDLSGLDELDGRFDRLDVGEPAPHLEGAARGDGRSERPPEQLLLGHEAEEPRIDRQPERPGIEIRDVVRGEHESVCRDVLLAVCLEAKDAEDQRPAGECEQAVQRQRSRHSAQYRAQESTQGAAKVFRMPRRLVIVESPAKARTIAGYLGPEFEVDSSIGHVRDLPERAADIPAQFKKEPWARLGVDVENDFAPLYVVDADKKKRVADLKKRLAGADELLLATDEDREGEAIAWHLIEVLKPKVPVRRMVFHEITRDAIERALNETRDIDERLVDAQETRRILDRLYGYEVSPVLWKKIMQGLSAGRVQSVATRLVVARERKRMAFVVAEYWDIEGTFEPGPFTARLVALDWKRVAVRPA